MCTFFLIILALHGLIHVLGFVKAFQFAKVEQLLKDISKPVGVLWLLTALAFIASAVLFHLQVEWWWMVALPALVLSQVLIGFSWSDAKFGTVVNIILLFPLVFSILLYLPTSYLSRYKADVRQGLARLSAQQLLTNEDIQHLPEPVQRYLHYVGAIGKPKVHNFRAVFTGEIRSSQESSWMEFTSHQYNFVDKPSRLFFIEAALFGIPFDGLHRFVDTSATMQIKVAGLFQVVDAKGEKMNQSETVTLFNDMCLMAPATLISRNIQWKAIDSVTVQATFTNNGITISALLSFDEQGALKNFISNDRFLSSDGITYKQYTWSTPVKYYVEVNGRKIPSYGETIWHTPEGEFTYGRFHCKEIEYNCPVLK